MNSIILIGDKKSFDTYLSEFISSHAIKPYYIERFETTLKIAEIRQLKKKISIKIEEQEKRLFVIESDITVDAQNAFLKTLEESPDSVFFVLCTSSKEHFISTILSRCHIIQLSREDFENDDEELMRKFQELNTSSRKNYHHLYSLMESCNFFSTKDDVDFFIFVYRQFIMNALKKEDHLAVSVVELFTDICEIYPLLQSNNINKKLTIESLFLR